MALKANAASAKKPPRARDKDDVPRADAQRSSPAKHAARPHAENDHAQALIDSFLGELTDWRGDTLSTLRAIIRAADPAIFEEWKWSTPVWSHPRAGLICTGEVYKSTVKLTFAKGAGVDDPDRLFNASLKGNTRRAIDLHEGDPLHERKLQALVRRVIAPGK